MSDFDAVDTARIAAVAIADRSEIVWVTGPDAISFLDGLLSQNIAAMGVGTTARSLLLAPNGKLRATLFVLRGDDRVGLVCDRGRSELVAGDLARFKIRVDVVIEIEDREIWEVWGPTAADFLDAAVAGGTWRSIGDSITVEMPFRYSDLPRLVVVGAAPPLPVVSADPLEPLRIEMGEPVMGIDLTERTIPQEGADVAGSVDFTKGCYLGQELVARIDSRGHVNQRLTGLVIAARPVPPPGTELLREGAVVGAVTSAAWSEARSCVVALGMVRVAVAAGMDVTIDSVAATVVDLPMNW